MWFDGADDEIAELRLEIGRAKRYLDDIQRAPHEGRWTLGRTAWMDRVANQQKRVEVLEVELAERLSEAAA